MSQFSRISAVTLVGLFLETCAFYLVIRMASAAFRQSEAGLPLWLVFLSLLLAFLLSLNVQTLPLARGLRGTVGLGASVLCLLFLSYLNPGPGPTSIGEFVSGNTEAAVVMGLSLAFLVLLWWRGVTLAQDEVGLETVRGSFRWGMAVLVVAVLAQSVTSADIVDGYMVVGFFAVGLAGLAMARFSWEAGDTQVMSANWLVPIAASVGGVILLALLIGALSKGGLDDVAQEGLKAAGSAGLLILKPVFLALGYLASLLVSLGVWIASLLGGGDLGALDRAQQNLLDFQESLESERGGGGPPTALVVVVKGGALLLATSAAVWLLYRIFRFRKLFRRTGEVEETRQSLFSWSRANRDLSALLSEWWNSLPAVGSGRGKPSSEPSTAREFYHRLLSVADRLGCPRQEWETPKQHQRALRGTLPVGPVGRIVDAFQLSHYGQTAADRGELAALRQDWQTINEFVDEQERQR